MREGTHVPANTHTHAPANTHTRTQCISLESVAEIQLTLGWGGGGRSNINGSGMTRVLDDRNKLNQREWREWRETPRVKCHVSHDVIALRSHHHPVPTPNIFFVPSVSVILLSFFVAFSYIRIRTPLDYIVNFSIFNSLFFLVHFVDRIMNRCPHRSTHPREMSRSSVKR